jgi:cation:H+ antiporter
MGTALAVPVFFASLVVTLAAASFFARRLDSVGVSLGLPEALLGLLTAVAADAPEITSALVALAKRAPGASLGVLVGSNVFNLAAMIGLAAVLTGRVRLRRESLLLEGSVGVLTTVVATGLLVGFLSPLAAALLTAAIIAPYVFLLLRGRRVAAFAFPLPRRVVAGLARSLGEREHAPLPRAKEDRIWSDALLIVPAVALIVAGSTGMVEAALSLADHWHASPIAVGVLVLAPLTSIPNAFTALRLGLARRGAALVSETLNSNTLNLAAGLVVPALFVTIAAVSREAKFELGWLFVMTFAALLMLARRRGMGRGGGSALIALYAAFVVIEVIRL